MVLCLLEARGTFLNPPLPINALGIVNLRRGSIYGPHAHLQYIALHITVVSLTTGDVSSIIMYKVLRTL